MKKIVLLCFLFSSFSWSQTTERHIITDAYELYIPKQQDNLLILYPCFPCDADNTKTEFPIIDQALAENIAVLLVNFNMRLSLTEEEKKSNMSLLEKVTKTNHINTKNTYIGGFSSGGNMSLLVSDYLIKQQSSIQPKGVFIVDSPIDLLGLYVNSKKNIQKNFSSVAVEESKWIINMLEKEFGTGKDQLVNFENNSPYIAKTKSLLNLTHLKNTRIRLYTEPDANWWKVNRQTDFEDTNAYYIEQLAKDLKENGYPYVEHITTTNKGYRNNGDRHPHSWSIVDKMGLINWIITTE